MYYNTWWEIGELVLELIAFIKSKKISVSFQTVDREATYELFKKQ